MILLIMFLLCGCVRAHRARVWMKDGSVLFIKGDDFIEDGRFIRILRNGKVVESFLYDDVNSISIEG